MCGGAVGGIGQVRAVMADLLNARGVPMLRMSGMVIGALATLLVGCATTKNAYTRARRLDTVAAYQAYLNALSEISGILLASGTPSSK